MPLVLRLPVSTIGLTVVRTLIVMFIVAGFGTTQSPFGVQPQQQQQQSLFGAPTQPGFGAASSTSLFGNTNQSSIFGASSSQSPAFGQSAASPSFGRPSLGSSPMFGSAQPASGFGSTFGSTSPFGTTASAFGATTSQAPNGTTIKFVPVTGTDTMMKNGVNQQISTRHQCITAMKEYESKSLEELRMEDYMANRKGPQAASAFGLTQPQSGNTSLFGVSNLGASSTGGFGGSLFNQAKPGFGSSAVPATSAPSIFNSGFGQNKSAFGSTSLFGGTAAQAPAQPAQTSLFGTSTQQQQAPAFGQTTAYNTFGTMNQNNASKPLFGSTSGISATPSFSGAFNTGSAAKPLFGPAVPQTAFGAQGLGSSTTFPSFSVPATSTTPSLFNAQPQQQSLFSSAAKPFSFSTTPAFGTTSTQPLQLNLGGGSGLFNNTNTFGSGMFGNTTGQPSLFGNQGLTTNNFLNVQQQGLQAQSQTNDLLLNRLQALPYGSSNLFKNDLNSIPTTSSKFTTDPKALNQYRLNARPQVQVQRTATVPVKSSLLFDDVEEKSDNKLSAQDIFCPRKNIKKLVFKPRTAETSPGEIVQSEEPVFHNARDTNDQCESTVCEFNPRRPTNNVEVADKDDSIRPLNFSLDTITSGDESIQSVLIRSPVPTLRCGLIQTRGDYYTIPPLEAIDACYSEENGTCILDNLTIGRKNYGSIYWDGPLDVQGINLDEVVHIRRKEVIVYPDDEEKPPVGKGLNRPAQITLDQVWPVDKTTNEVIRDVSRLEQMNYAAKIEAATIKLKATFRDYRPDTGSWVFCVKHFSKYGIFDDDDDEPMAVGGAPVAKVTHPTFIPQMQERKLPVEELNIPTPREVPEKTVIHKISAFSTRVDQRFLDLPSADSFPFKSGFDTFEERFQPQTDYFGGIRSVLFSGEDDCDGELVKPGHKQKRQKVVEFESSSPPTGLKPSKPKRRNDPPMIVTTHHRRQLNWMIDPFPSTNQVFLDIASIKCAPSPRVSFIKGGSNNFITVSGKSIVFSKIDLIPDLEKFSARMEAQYTENSLIRTHPQVMAYADTVKKSCNSKNDGELNHLVVALFGDLKTKTEYEQQEERINRVIDWLASRNKRQRLPSEPIDKIFHHLCNNDAQAAVDEAIKSKNPRLATLLSTSTCTSSKEYILFQLDSWKSSEADHFIHRDLMKLYVLVSGVGSWTLSNGEEICPFDGLSWSQQLILMLRYNLNADLKECIAALNTESTDVEYHLLKQLDKDQWITLSYCQNDLESWFLHASFLSYDVIQDDVRSDILSGNLVSQLMSKSVRWATFAAQHILDDELRHKLVGEIFSRQGFTLTGNEVNWMTERLAIPANEIASSKSIFHRSTFEDVECALSLLDCQQWVAAHDLLVEKIFPELVINEELDMLSSLVNRLKEARNSIPNWFTNGAHVYDVYATAKLGSGDGVLALLQQSVIKLNLMKCPTNRHVFAQCEMAMALSKLAETSNSHLLAQLRSNCAPIIQNLVL